MTNGTIVITNAQPYKTSIDVDGIYGIGIGTILTEADQQKMYKKCTKNERYK